jgi:hypothetical protein
MKDLVILVADKDMQFALQGMLERFQALRIRKISYDFRVHPQHDAGVRVDGASVLAAEHRRFKHALMVLDHEGCGFEDKPALELESQLDAELAQTWSTCAKAIVVEPEVDVWVWGSDNALQDVFRWQHSEGIRSFLSSKGFEFNVRGKPIRPKEALDELRPIHKIPRSSSLYERITSKISLQNCSDPSFQRLCSWLQQWFPASADVPPMTQ